MTDVRLTVGDLELLRAIVARRQPSLIDAIAHINTGEITAQQQRELVDVLGDELWEHGMDNDGLTEAGEPVRYLIESVQVVPYLARDCDFAAVVLLTPIPADQIAVPALAPGEGLVPGDSVGVADVTPAQVRVVVPSAPLVAAPGTDD